MAETRSDWINEDGVTLCCYEWNNTQEKHSATFIVYVVHGYGDYAGRYAELAGQFVRAGGCVYSHDHFAHGRSGPFPLDSPSRCQAQNLSALIRDLSHRLAIVRRRHSATTKCFVYAHSFGGLLALKFALDFPAAFDNLIVQAPALIAHSQSAGWFTIAAAKLLNLFVPNFKITDENHHFVTREEKEVNSLKNDELANDVGGITVRLAVNMLHLATEVLRRLPEIRHPTFIASGSDDFILDKKGCDICAEKIENNTYKLYDGAYHSLHVEIPATRQEFFADLLEWTIAFTNNS